MRALRQAGLVVRWDPSPYVARSPAVRALLDYGEHLLGLPLSGSAARGVLECLFGLTASAAYEVAQSADSGDGVISVPMLPVPGRGHEVDQRLREMSPGASTYQRLVAAVTNHDFLNVLSSRDDDDIEMDAVNALLAAVTVESEYLTIRELRSYVSDGGLSRELQDPSWRTDPGIVVLTRHQSKGLQWGSVLLPVFASRRRPGPPAPTLIDAMAPVRIGLRDVRSELDPRTVLDAEGVRMARARGETLVTQADATYWALRRRADADTAAEELRLLYVAVTRAERRLTAIIMHDGQALPVSTQPLVKALETTEEKFGNAVVTSNIHCTLVPVTTLRTRPTRTSTTPAAAPVPRPLVPLPLSATQLEAGLDD